MNDLLSFKKFILKRKRKIDHYNDLAEIAYNSVGYAMWTHYDGLVKTYNEFGSTTIWTLHKIIKSTNISASDKKILSEALIYFKEHKDKLELGYIL